MRSTEAAALRSSTVTPLADHASTHTHDRGRIRDGQTTQEAPQHASAWRALL
jgi:hypothetical protein